MRTPRRSGFAGLSDAEPAGAGLVNPHVQGTSRLTRRPAGLARNSEGALVVVVLLLLLLVATTHANVRYRNREGVMSFVPKPWMVPVSLQGQLPADAVNPFPIYDWNGSYTFTVTHVDGNLTLWCEETGERLTPYGLALPMNLGSSHLEAPRATIQNHLRMATQMIAVTDDTQRDLSGRLLAYLFADGTFINQEILTGGQMAYNPPDRTARYDSFLRDAETFAKDNRVGIWAFLLEKRPPGAEELTKWGTAVPVSMPVMVEDRRRHFHTLFCQDGVGGDPVTRDLAVSLGYTPCPRCQPSAEPKPTQAIDPQAEAQRQSGVTPDGAIITPRIPEQRALPTHPPSTPHPTPPASAPATPLPTSGP